MSLAVVIVNFRTVSMTMDCLRSLAAQIARMSDVQVIVVDNGSDDGSARQLQEHAKRLCWDWLQVLALPENIGFAAGNNRGLAMVCNADYVLLLNSDTLVHDGCLQHCTDLMDEQPTVGAMSCLLLGSDGLPQVTARRFSTPVRQFVCALGLPWRLPRLFRWADPEEAWDRRTVRRDVDWIGGAFMFCRLDLLNALGGFDEAFFFYGEDYELCHRIHRAGHRIHYDPRVSITHLGGGSSDTSRLPSPQKMSHVWRARYLVCRKCHGMIASTILRGLDLLNYGAIAVFNRLRWKKKQAWNQKPIIRT